MSRWAEYIQYLAILFSEQGHVHLVGIKEGSTTLVQRVDPESAPKVRARVGSIDVTNGEGPQDALRAFRAINRRLAEDNSVGHLYEGNGAQILYFPGCERVEPLTFGVCDQPGSLDGLLIKIGGKDETVPVHLQEGDTVHICNATRTVARRLAPHLFATRLRVHGNGNWERDEDGVWNLKRFNIAEFEVLDDASLGEVVARLREVPGNGWREIDDPYTELQYLRRGSEERHRWLYSMRRPCSIF